MEAQQSQWGAMTEGQIIREHRTGMLWKIVKMNKTHAGLRNRAGDERIIERPGPFQPVTVMVLTDEELSTILTEKLGARPIWFQRGNETAMTCPSYDEMDRSDRKFHLEYFHGMVVGNAKEDKRRDLVALHDEAHRLNDGKGLPHVHLGWPEVEDLRRI